MNSILTTKIETIDDARAYFEGMGCSHFHMGRESDERYNEYKAMHISKELETEWRKETMEMIAKTLPLCEPEQIWYKHSLMIDICQMVKDVESFILLLRVTNNILKRLPKHDYLLVAENFMGRTDVNLHRGFVYDCYSVDQRLAGAFMKIVDYLIMYGEDSIERVVNARARYDEIMKYLHL